MKHIKLLFSTSLLLFSGNLCAQAIFANKSKFMTMSDAPAFTQVNFLNYISEKVNLDSVKNDTSFYTVNFFQSDSNYSDQYYLKCYSNKVYFSGKIIDYYPYKAFSVKDVLIYDFNLKAGDLMSISENSSKMDIKIGIDSVKNITYKDGISRKTQFYHVISSNLNEYNQFNPTFFAIGLGGDHGILPFKIRNRNTPFWQRLISACNQDSVNMYLDDFWLRDYPFKPCDEKDFSASIKKLRTASILPITENRISVYPNPTNSNLKIDGVESGSYVILNSLGQTMLSGHFTREILTEILKPGYYSIIILNNSSKFESKFIKN
jgi:hypothetical protein